LAAYIPKIIIEAIQNHLPTGVLLLRIAWLSLALLVLEWLEPNLFERVNSSASNLQKEFQIMAFEKMLHTDYQNLESYEGRRKLERCRGFIALDNEHNESARVFCHTLVYFFVNVFGIITYIALLGKAGLPLVLLVLGTAIFDVALAFWKSRKTIAYADAIVPLELRSRYFSRISTSPKAGKDVRLYKIIQWFDNVLQATTQAHNKALARLTRQNLQASVGQTLLAMIREATAYAFLVYSAWYGKMSIANFIFYSNSS
jgi:ATP-binding cassette subfamily B protein